MDFKPNFIQWHEGDFRANRKVNLMSARERDNYRNLLMECYYGEHRPRLRADDPDMWLFANCETPEEWERNKEAVLRQFYTVEIDGVLMLENKRVMEEWEIIVARLDQRKSAGLASARKRAERSLNGRSSVAEDRDNDKKNENEKKKEKENHNHNQVVGERSTVVERSSNGRSAEADLTGLTDIFFKTTGRVLILSGETKSAIARAVQEHGRDVIEKAIHLFVQGGHDWDKVKSPGALFVSKLAEYLPAAKQAAADQRRSNEVRDASKYLDQFKQQFNGDRDRGSPEWIERIKLWYERNFAPNDLARGLLDSEVKFVKKYHDEMKRIREEDEYAELHKNEI